MTNRAQVIGEHGRVISAPNGLWQAQRFAGGKGVNATSKTPHYDPWENVGRPTSREEALKKIR